MGKKKIDRSQIDDIDVFDQKRSKSRTSGQTDRITDDDEYEKAKGIFGRIKSFFSRS